MGIASLVLGIIGIICCFLVIIAPLGVVLTLIGLILGIVDIVKKGKKEEKRGLSIAGLIICAITFFVLVIESFLILSLGLYIFDEVTNHDYNSITSEENVLNQTDYIERKDKISGNSFIVKDGESLLNLHEDGTFEYYQDKNELTDNYYEGTYKVYNGEDAISYITNDLEEYGITEQEQRDLFARSDIYDVENYYCLILVNNKCIMNGENILTSVVETPYFGFYHEDEEILDIANMNTGSYVCFVKEKK